MGNHTTRILVLGAALAATGVLTAAAPGRAQTQPATGRGTVSGDVNPGTPGNIVWLEGLPAGSWSVPSQTVALSETNGRLAPEFAVVVAGQTVQFTNQDRAPHTVFSTSPGRQYDFGPVAPGASRALVFDQPGTVALSCRTHRNESATFVVVPTTYYATTSQGGRFSIPNVPPGHYRVVATSPRGGTASNEIDVPAGGNVNVTLPLTRGPG